MKNILTTLLIVLSFTVFSQVSNTKVVRIADDETAFGQALSEGNILINLATDSCYLMLKPILGINSLSGLTVNVDYKSLIDEQDISGIATNASNIAANTTSIGLTVLKNASISGGSNTIITYDAKGLITGGTDATTSDITEGSNLYYTEARVSANTDVATNTAHTSNDNDLYNDNEGVLSVGAGTSTTSILQSNTNGSSDIVFSVGEGLSISESGNTITIENSASITEVDGNISNELIDSMKYSSSDSYLRIFEGGSSTPDSVQINGGEATDSSFVWVEADTLFIGADTMTEYPKTLPNYLNLGDGMALQKASITIDGSLQFEVEAMGGGDITFQIDGNNYVLDCTSNGKAKVALTAGADSENPQVNFVYATINNNEAELNASSALPNGAFAWIGKVVVPDVSTFSTTGAYVIQRFTESFSNGSRGPLSHEREKLRAIGAVYISGVTPSAIVSSNSVQLHTTAGQVYQLHRQIFPAFNGGSYYYGNGTNKFANITDLTSAVLTSNNSSIGNNRRFNLVIWGAVNLTEGDCKLFVNLPTGTYKNDDQARNDVSNTADYSVPQDFRSVAFLIARIVLKIDKNGNYSELATYNLAGVPVAVRTGGTAPIASTAFSDSEFTIFDNDDEAKQLNIEVSAITTGTTRTITIPDYDVDFGNITATNVSGTVAIANGGTSATSKSAAFNALSPMSAEGDIIIGGASGTGTALTRGTTGQVLTMNSGATAPEWATNASLESPDGNKIFSLRDTALVYNNGTKDVLSIKSDGIEIDPRDKKYLLANGTWSNAIVVGTEYISPEQHGGVFGGMVYRVYISAGAKDTSPQTIKYDSGSGNITVGSIVDFSLISNSSALTWRPIPNVYYLNGTEWGIQVLFNANDFEISYGTGAVSVAIKGWIDYTK